MSPLFCFHFFLLSSLLYTFFFTLPFSLLGLVLVFLPLSSNSYVCMLWQGEVVKLADFGSCRSIYSKPPYTEYISTRWFALMSITGIDSSTLCVCVISGTEHLNVF